jgi:hypothetical protein
VTGDDVQMVALDHGDVVYVEHVPGRGSTAKKVGLGAACPPMPGGLGRRGAGVRRARPSE